jgi:very-short-patch-repair endonuclease
MAKEIIDEKTLYLIKTLSRTRRKDYENYVINAIWQKLGSDDIKIISQQYVEDVRMRSGHLHYFIDLYFPDLNIGVECDEAFHKEQSSHDKEREIIIYDVLHAIKSDGYEAIHIDAALPFEQFQASIEKAAEKIRQKITAVNPPKWKNESAKEYYKNKKIISITDRKGFRTIDETCNILFNTGYNEKSGGSKQSYFRPFVFRDTNLENYKVWFPKLAVPIKNEDGSIAYAAATKSGWNNQLVNDGKEIIETNEKEKPREKINYKDADTMRIAFAKYNDPLGNSAYKFIGVFRRLLKDKDNNGKNRYYTRVSETCPLLK